MTEGVEPSEEDSTPSSCPPGAEGERAPSVSRSTGSTIDPVQPGRWSRRRRWAVGVLAVFAAIVVLHGVVIETFTVPSGSMQPTLWHGDRILVNKVHAGDVARDDVIVFDATDVFVHPDRPRPSGLAGFAHSVGDFLGFHFGETLYVKRVIGLPGDTVSVGHDGRLRINGTVHPEPFLTAGMVASKQPFTVRVPEGHVFVMGDNRPASDDSRSHLGDPGGGMVPTDDIVGTVVLRYWPIGSWGRLSQ